MPVIRKHVLLIDSVIWSVPLIRIPFRIVLCQDTLHPDIDWKCIRMMQPKQQAVTARDLRRPKHKWDDYKVFLLALPAIAIVILFRYIPLWGWSFSLFQYKPGKDLFDCNFVGLQNFTFLFNNPVMRKGFNLMTSDDHVWLYMVLLQQWKSLGWSAIIYFASIAGIPQDMYEAAMIDGANRMQRIWYITIPSLIPTYFVLLIMSIGNFLNTGVDQYLTFGNALNKQFIEVLDLYVYNLGIGSGQISFSVAVGIMKSVVALVLFSMANFASKKIRGESVF